MLGFRHCVVLSVWLASRTPHTLVACLDLLQPDVAARPSTFRAGWTNDTSMQFDGLNVPDGRKVPVERRLTNGIQQPRDGFIGRLGTEGCLW